MREFSLMGQLEPPDLWVVQVLRVAGGWVTAEKIAAVLCAVKLHYPVPGVRFELNNGAVRSPEVEEALKRLVEQGLVEESKGAYRLTKRGNKLAEKVLPHSGWALPYADVVFYLEWDVRRLAEHVQSRTS